MQQSRETMEVKEELKKMTGAGVYLPYATNKGFPRKVDEQKFKSLNIT
jgi:hypothetical protein